MEMKIKALGVKKTSLRSEFTFEKNWEVTDRISDMLSELGMVDVPDHNLKDLIFSRTGPGPKFDIKELVDEVYNLKNGNYSVDVFIGLKKIVLIINSRVNRHKEVSEAVFKFADFDEVSK